MRKALLLAVANVRKAKSQTVIMALLLMVAAVVLNIGAVVLFGFGSFFDRTARELNCSDAVLYIPKAVFNDQMVTYLQQNASDLDMLSSIVVSTTEPWNGRSFTGTTSFVDVAAPRDMSRWQLVGDSLPLSSDSVYVPYLYQAAGGYNLGDRLTYVIDSESYNFTVAGFFEGIWHDHSFFGDTALVPSARYQQLSNELPQYSQIVVYANGLTSLASAQSALTEIAGDQGVTISQGGATFTLILATDLAGEKLSRTALTSLTAGMMLVLAVIVVAVCLLVIRFRISNTIDEDLPKIGSLKAIGYTNGQISASVAAQYGMVALAASLVGTAGSYALLPTASDILAIQSGLYWRPGLQPIINLIGVAALVGVVVGVTWLASLIVRRYSVVAALRGGITTHSFKSDPLPLSRSRLPLTLSLAAKAMLQGARSTITTLAVITAVAITATVAVVLFYNSAIDVSAFEKVPGFERSNVTIVFEPNQDADALLREVATNPDVRFAQYMDYGRALVQDVDVPVVVMDDFDHRVTDNIYSGVGPRYDNEIALSGALAKEVGKHIGDQVIVGRAELPFIVTGLFQGMETGSLNQAYLTLDGMRTLDAGFQQTGLKVYLNQGVDTPTFVDKMQSTLRGKVATVFDTDEIFEIAVGSYASIMVTVGAAILMIAGLIVVLVLYLMVGSMILRKRRELGVYKAIGYTTLSLMNQIALSLAIPVALGAAAGCIGGAVMVNPMVAISMASSGVMKASFIVAPWWVAGTDVCIVAITYLAGLLFTRRIRGISAYALVTE